MASEMGMDVVWRLNWGNEGEDMIGSEVYGSDEFGSEMMGIKGVGSDAEGSKVVCCWALDFALGALVCVKGEVEDVVTMVETVGGERGIDEASFLEP